VTSTQRAPEGGTHDLSSADRARLAERPLVIVGPTASGKSDLALAVAGGIGAAEIVTLDSMQVYRGMDIGTATPTAAEQCKVPHHLIDLVDPSEDFAVAELQARARIVIDDIRGRGCVPVLVGGTGLYVRAVIDDLKIPGRYPEARADLEAVPDTSTLYRQLVDLDPVAAGRMEPTNRRRIVRALEVTIGSGEPFSSYGPGLGHYPPTPFVQVGLRWDRDRLDQRIAVRYQRQLADGFLDEVRALAGRPISHTAAQALGYKELLAHVRGEATLDEALDLAVVRTRRFARRQERWFRRDPRIHWLDAPATPFETLLAFDDIVSTENLDVGRAHHTPE
jgi:tRNA dimethylallyltransferase